MSNEALPLEFPRGQDLEDLKTDLRRQVRASRARRSAKEKLACAAGLLENSLSVVQAASTVAAYVSVEDEPRTLDLLEALHGRGVRVLLPKLGPGLSREWGLYQGSLDLEVRAPRRPPEPSLTLPAAEALVTAQVVLAPALSVDGGGRRLGQGGGWYDRVLLQAQPGARFFALIYDAELVAGPLPTDEHDISMHGAITPERVIHFGVPV